ncbi:MAG: hypothetical protein J6W35_02135 [Eubacterium sp.]|nr:hypothetical protein [Eubacterium sp.]
MGKVEQDGKIEQFKAAMNNRDYDTAVQIADTLDIKHIRDNNLLSLVADAYELSNDYELAKQVLLYAYENTKAGRHLAYRLCLVSIKNGEIDEAEEYYEDFVEMAPKDTGRYVLKYKMAEALNKPKDELIKILEEYVNIDMEEKWAYELAKLYKETGDTAKCVELCDEMGLWFSEGRYIKKAMELKKSIQPLNITQQQLLDKEDPVEEEEVVEKPKSEPHVSKSPIESIMEKQPERTPYVDPEEPKSFGIDLSEEMEEPERPSEPKHFGIDLKEEGFGEEKPVKPGLDKPLGESSFENERQNEYKPSFDITEIKVADEPKIQPENILTAQPVEDGPKQMSFFNDDSPSNNKFDEPKETPNFEKPDFLKEENMPDMSETPAEEPLPGVDDVEDMLKSLQERGILGADTVNKAVNAINSDTHQIEEELKEEVDSIMSEQEETPAEIETPEEIATPEEPAVSVEPEAPEEPETTADSYEKPQNRYTREEPEEIEPIVPEMANNFSDDNDVAEKIIQGKDFTQPDIPELDETEDSKFHTVQIGNKWEADDESETDSNLVEDSDRAPVEAGEMDDFEPEVKENDDVAATKDIGDVMHKPTEVMPDSDELEKESKKPIQAAKVLDEAVRPTSEQPKDVPVFDLSGEYTTQDNNEPEVEQTPVPAAEQTPEPAAEQAPEPAAEQAPPVEESKLEPEPKIEMALKESNGSSADIDMISGDTPDNKPEAQKEEPKQEPSEEVKAEPEAKAEPETQAEDLGATKVVDVPVKKELKHKMRKEKKKELNTERVKFDVEDSDMAVFGNYLNVEGLEDAVKKVCNDLIKKFTGREKDLNANVIVMGDEKTGKTTMAIEIIKLINKKSERRNRKIAKISASTLNRKGFASVLGKIRGCDLIIENAHDIHTTTIQEIVKSLYPNTTDSIIILEAETEPMEELLSSTPSLGQAFEQVIRIKQYNIREWVAYGSEYAKTQGYKLDEVAELALFKSIDDAFGAHKGISRLDVEEIIDKAISRSDRFGKKLFGSKKDDEGLKLLDESDFNINLK